MKKILIFTAVLLLAAGCGKKVSNENKQQSPDQNQKTSGQQSFKALASGKPQKCEVTFNQDGNAQTKGSTFVGNGKMRGDYTSTVAGKTIVSHMIMVDQTVYTWMDGQTTGFKMKADQETTSPTQGQTAKPVDLEQKVDYVCENWHEDPSQFTPPTSVTFSDFSDMIPKSIQPTGSNGQPAACSACDQAPAEAKAQCKAALGCK